MKRRGIISWMAHNPVAANLLMITLLLGGFLGLQDIRKEITPDFSLDGVSISMAYPGASPEEVEQGIVLPIEKELMGMEGIDSISAKAAEGSASVTVELEENADAGKALQDVRNAVSRITTFPDDTEQPRVSLRQHGFYVISIGVSADLSAQDLSHLSEQIKRRLLAMQGVSEVNIRGRLAPEITFEIPRERLHALGLTLSDVAKAVRNSARDIPAGSIETSDGEILLRTLGRRERASDYADIALKTLPDGSRILLKDIALIIDGFQESSYTFRFNGRNGVRLDIYQTVGQRPVELAGEVRKLVGELSGQMPDGIAISIQNDRSKRYAERQNILLKNGAMGLGLVVLALGIFLNIRLAFWVAVSIPVVYIGSFTLLPQIDVTLNMISMFAFILTLGIVVDDAIIVGENIHTKTQEGLPIQQAISQGTHEMVVPVLFAVGTNIIAFIPLMLVPGTTGQFMRSLPIVACVVFLVSLVEALLILPAHLHSRNPLRRKHRFHDAMMNSLDRLRDGPFLRLLMQAISARYLTVLIFSGLLAIVIAWYASDRIDLTWRPVIPGNRVDAELEMPVDASIKDTLATINKIEAAALRAIDKLGGRQYLESWFTRAGAYRPTYGDVNMFLVGDEQRPFTQEEFTRVWRNEIGDLPQIKSLFFEYLVGPGGNRGLRINLSHSSTAVLEQAAQTLAAQMTALSGVVDVNDGVAQGKRQIAFTLTPEGLAQGLTESSLGRQVRNAFHGAEALRLLRDGDEVKVMVKLPKTQRLSIQDLRDFILRTADGTEIPLNQAAVFHEGKAYSTINREDNKRILKITASIDKANASTRQIRATLTDEILPQLQANNPGLQWKFSGGRRDQNKAMKSLLEGLTWVVLAIFVLMAALFHRYSQGLIVIATIPYSVAAAIAGHIFLGFDLSSVSIFGMMALAGLVVNGALVLTLRLNDKLPEQLLDDVAQKDYHNALIQAVCSRFRPIVLTSLTTTAGLFPMLFETSTQAQFLVPMAVTLSFGTLASALVVLLLIPALHAINHDLQTWAGGKGASE